MFKHLNALRERFFGPARRSEPIILDAPVRRIKRADAKVRAARKRQSAMRRRRSRLVGHRRHKR